MEKGQWPCVLPNTERKQNILSKKTPLKHRSALLSWEDLLFGNNFSSDPSLSRQTPSEQGYNLLCDYLLKIQQCFKALGHLTLRKWLVKTFIQITEYFVKISTLMSHSICSHWLPRSGASLMKPWRSTRQRTSSLNTTKSQSSSSSARTTGWVKEACWEPAGKCVWALSMQHYTVWTAFIAVTEFLHCDAAHPSNLTYFLCSQQVFLHCQVLVCGAGDSRCAQHCRGRLRREVRTPEPQELHILRGGPIFIRPEPW